MKGELWASIDVRHDTVVRNMTAYGALLEITLGSADAPMHAAAITLPDGGPELSVRIRHMQPVIGTTVANRYLLGVEFVQLSSAERQAIAAFINARK